MILVIPNQDVHDQNAKHAITECHYSEQIISLMFFPITDEPNLITDKQRNY